MRTCIGVILAAVGVILAAVLAFVLACLVHYPSNPLSGKLKSVAITKRFVEEGATNTAEKSLTITNTQELAQLHDAANPVPQKLIGLNSGEGFPKYWMQVTYADGKSETILFTRTDWGRSGLTPKRLLKYLEQNGL